MYVIPQKVRQLYLKLKLKPVNETRDEKWKRKKNIIGQKSKNYCHYSYSHLQNLSFKLQEYGRRQLPDQFYHWLKLEEWLESSSHRSSMSKSIFSVTRAPFTKIEVDLIK